MSSPLPAGQRQIQIRMSTQLYDQLVEQARQEQRSIASLCRLLLQVDLDRLHDAATTESKQAEIRRLAEKRRKPREARDLATHVGRRVIT